MRKLLMLALALASLAGCSNKDYDPDMCDFYQSLSAAYDAHQGYTPSSVNEALDKYCTR